VRGLYRYESGKDRWWACAEDDKGERVHIERSRYEAMGVQPSFQQLPAENDGSNGKSAKRRA
jgi:hypothetical protein